MPEDTSKLAQAASASAASDPNFNKDVIDLRDTTSIKGKAKNTIQRITAYKDQLVNEFKIETNAPGAIRGGPISLADTHKDQPKGKDHSYITKLPTFAERGTAIGDRLEKIKADPKYQKLTPEHQAKIRSDLYNKLVPKSYEGFHLPVPDHDTWVQASGRDTDHLMREGKLSQTYEKTQADGGRSDFWRRNKEANESAGAGFTKGINNIKMFGLRVENKALLAQHGIMENLSHGHMPTAALDKATLDKIAQKNDVRAVQNSIDYTKNKIQDADFWLQTHPRDTVIGRLDGMVGEQVATLPFYEALTGGIGEIGVLKNFTKGFVSSAPTLTQKLVGSRLGRWVARRLVDSADGFASSLVTSGGDKAEATESGITQPLMNPALHGVGRAAGKAVSEAVKIASAPLIKKFYANTVAMGGKPLQEELINSAAHEEEQLIEHMASQHEEPHAGEGLEQMKRATLMNEFMKKQEDRATLDPVNHKLHDATKQSLNSISIQMHGKPLRGVSKNQREAVRTKALSMVSEAAAEAPAHLPELHKMEVEQNLSKERQANPTFDATAKMLEKYGVKIADTVHENEITKIKEETGIKNGPASARKTSNANNPRNLRLGTGEDKNALLDVQKFASLNSESVAYMRSPRNRAKVAEAVSDRSKDGLNKFIDLLSSSTKDFTPFNKEDPYHLMIYHYGNKEKLPEGVANALTYRMKQIAGKENYKADDFKREALAMRSHLYGMARQGSLFTQGNVYRSTDLGAPFSWTKWQNQLTNEGDKAIIDATTKALKQHPEAQKAYLSVIKQLKKARPNIKSVEQYYNYVSNFDETSAKYARSFQ